MEKNVPYYEKKCALDSFWVRFWVKRKRLNTWKLHSFRLFNNIFWVRFWVSHIINFPKYNVSSDIS